VITVEAGKMRLPWYIVGANWGAIIG
jgi:hypothetical protein